MWTILIFDMWSEFINPGNPGNPGNLFTVQQYNFSLKSPTESAQARRGWFLLAWKKCFENKMLI